MKTRALHIHVTAYDPEHWAIAAVEDTYEAGVLKGTDMLTCHWTDTEGVAEAVTRLLRDVMQREAGRLLLEGRAGDQGARRPSLAG